MGHHTQVACSVIGAHRRECYGKSGGLDVLPSEWASVGSQALADLVDKEFEGGR